MKRSRPVTSDQVERQYQDELAKLQQEKSQKLQEAQRFDLIAKALGKLMEKYDISVEELCAIANPDLERLSALLGFAEGKRFFINPLNNKIVQATNPGTNPELRKAKASISKVDRRVFTRYSSIECDPFGSPLNKEDFDKIALVAKSIKLADS